MSLNEYYLIGTIFVIVVFVIFIWRHRISDEERKRISERKTAKYYKPNEKDLDELEKRKEPTFFAFIIILLLNYGMLSSGYLGETNRVDKVSANVIGFVFFIALYLFIYIIYVRPKYNFDNNILYFSFVFLWAIYGIVYYFDEEEKNIGYNILDLFAKCFVGIFFWAYYTKVFTL